MSFNTQGFGIKVLQIIGGFAIVASALIGWHFFKMSGFFAVIICAGGLALIIDSFCPGRKNENR